MTTLLINGRIWQWSQATLAGPKAMLAAADDGTAHTMAEWMLLEHGRIASVGTGVPPEAGAAHTIDLGGRLVLPGLIDVQQFVESWCRSSLPWPPEAGIPSLAEHPVWRSTQSGGAPSLAGHPV